MAPQLVDNPRESRYELHVDGETVAWAEYRPAGGSVIIAHTEVAAEHAGEGLGGLLTRAVFDAARADGRTVIPICPFAAAYVRRNPELVDDVAPSLRSQFRADRSGDRDGPVQPR